MVFLEIMMIGKKKLKLKNLRKSSKMFIYIAEEVKIKLRLRYINKKAKNSILSFVVSIEDLRILKYHTFSKKTVVLSFFFCSFFENEEEELIEIFQNLGLI